jgi:hypothetical protein
VNDVKLIGSIAVVALTLAAGFAGGVGAAPADSRAGAQAALREFEGTVVSVDRDARTFRLRDTERGTVRIKVTRATRFERLDGFGALKPGLRRVEASVRRSNRAWVATEVERSGGGGEHGGDDDRRGGDDDDRDDDDRGGDDDDRGGDDHGGSSGPGR